ncbi:MAG TPA: PLP-dependent aspartate aminotransferase family protein [Clostridia bacterium]|nr:PLP-dependent aspartate aminotransferase family protein [Clostridia bacterium]HPK17016.1 PLP-dependent aspartate aminotransferase family protein [Clostridia bacterium]
MRENKPYGIETLAIHAGQQVDPLTDALIPPVHLSATYVFHGDKLDRYLTGDEEMYTYARTANPTQDQLEEKIAAMEGAQAALATASGMAAITNAIMAFAGSGEHVIFASTIYGGTYYATQKVFKRMGIECTLLDAMDDDTLDATVRDNTRILYFETLSNPTLAVADVERLAAWAKRRGIISIIDNTFMSPYLFNPLRYGVDIAVHSTTKYINGHGDQLGGVIVGSKELIDTVHFRVYQNLGAVPSPLNCYLTMRGMKTLPMRMDRHCGNAMALARAMEANPRVVRVDYPGLESHPGHALAKKLFLRGFGGMLSISLDGGADMARKAAEGLKLGRYCASLGDLETLVETPANMTHGKMAPEVRVKMGIPDGMLRVSVGCESPQDIIGDFEQAIKAL